MGKKASTRKPQAKRKPVLDRSWVCPYCNMEGAVEVKLDKANGIATLSCGRCMSQDAPWQTTIKSFTHPVDVYYEWIDKAAEYNTPEKLRERAMQAKAELETQANNPQPAPQPTPLPQQAPKKKQKQRESRESSGRSRESSSSLEDPHLGRNPPRVPARSPSRSPSRSIRSPSVSSVDSIEIPITARESSPPKKRLVRESRGSDISDDEVSANVPAKKVRRILDSDDE